MRSAAFAIVAVICFVAALPVIYIGAWGAEIVTVSLALVGVVVWSLLLLVKPHRNVLIWASLVAAFCCAPVVATTYISYRTTLYINWVVPVASACFISFMVYISLRLRCAIGW